MFDSPEFLRVSIIEDTKIRSNNMPLDNYQKNPEPPLFFHRFKGTFVLTFCHSSEYMHRKGNL
jgi:hypothetical protein